jgi:hypothetical protein
MPVYDLKEMNYLENDLNNILNRLSDIYFMSFNQNIIEITPKLSDSSESFWASEENTKEFNKQIPNFKSLHRDMYSFIENVAVFKFQKYDYLTFELKYPNFKEFRLLNNQLKHQNTKSVDIHFVKVVHINQKLFDLLCNFQYPDKIEVIMYSEFVKLFLMILNDLKLIKSATI